jgi:polysaccharide biosynthesis transport protein
MSVEFRKRTTEEYLAIVNRRKWHLILPTFVFLVAVGWVAYHMPSMYESTTYLTIRNPIVSEKVAPSLTDARLSERILAMTQNILSRSSLEPIVRESDLFAEERAAGLPMEEILVRMRANITVDYDRADDERITGFRLTYKDRSPEAAQKVAATLANKYVAVQSTEAEQGAQTTSEFLDKQLADAKQNLDVLDQQRMGIMTQNVETLPESAQGLIAQLEGLRKREETISKDKETLFTEKGRLMENIQAMNNQIRLIEDMGEKEVQEAINQSSRVEDTPAYGQLIQRRAELSSRLESLKKQYREKHPDVIQAQTDIEKINEELTILASGTARRAKLASQGLARKTEVQKKSLEIEKQKSESSIGQIDQQLRMKDGELQQNSAQIADLEAKLNQIPNVRVALEGINNQYTSAKAVYEEVLKKYNAAQGQVNRETQKQGERIRVVDPANLPLASTTATKKPLFVLMGAGIGLALGLIFAGFYELPRLMKIQNVEDAKHYSGLPVLASVPEIVSDDEIDKRRRWSQFALASAIVASLLMVPILALGLEASGLLERLG